MLAQRPLAEEALVRGREVGLADHALLARLPLDELLRGDEVDVRDLGGDVREREVEQLELRASPRVLHRADHAGEQSRSTAMTVKWSSMKPSSTSSDTYSARWRTVSCGSARNTGPIS